VKSGVSRTQKVGGGEGGTWAHDKYVVGERARAKLDSLTLLFSDIFAFIL